jgi:hypothetical protein
MELMELLKAPQSDPVIEEVEEELQEGQEIVIKKEDVEVKKEEHEGIEMFPVTEDEVQLLESDETMGDTAARIQDAIKEITEQLNMVKQSESLITNEQEREYYESVVQKLEEQLEELKQIYHDLSTYKEIIESARFEKEMAQMQVESQMEELKVVEEAMAAVSMQEAEVVQDAAEDAPPAKTVNETKTVEDALKVQPVFFVAPQVQPVMIRPEEKVEIKPNTNSHEQMKATNEFIKASPTPSKMSLAKRPKSQKYL